MANQQHCKHSLAKLRVDHPRGQRRLPLWIIVLALIILACNLTSPPARRVVMINRLPTFTRTPLPTLVVNPTSTPLIPPPVPATEPVEISSAPTGSETSQEEVPLAAAATATLLPVSGLTPAPPGAAPTSFPPPDSPTATPVASSSENTVAPATPTDVPPSPTPTPTVPSVTATPTPSLESAGWTFASIGRYPDQDDDSLLLYGNVINNTGSAQALTFITGTFYDGQGQVIADEGSTFDYWPIETIPPGGQIPFELTIYDIQEAANFDLEVGAEESGRTPHQNFEFSQVIPTVEGETYCLTGKLQNLAEQLDDYLLLVLTLYDNQNSVINFGDYYASGIEGLVGDQTITFEICADTHTQEIANYNLQAWGL